MSFLSGLFGDRRPVSQTNPSDHPTSANVFSSTSFSPTTSQTPSQPGPSNFSQPFNAPAPTALDTFSTSFDPARLHPLAGLGTDKLDFLQLDEDKLTDVQGATSVLPSRGWTDDLCVGTGTTYLSGLAVGGMWGLREGVFRPLGNRSNFKLRLNSVLNACTRRGTLLGNSLGVLAIFYNITNSSLDSFRGKHDVLNSIGAAAASGALYKSTAGARPAMVSAGVMSAAAGAWSIFKTLV